MLTAAVATLASLVAFSATAPTAADEGAQAYCTALEDYTFAVAEVGHHDDADLTVELRALAAAGLAALDELPEEVAVGNLDASAEFCGLERGDREAPNRARLTRYLTDVVQATDAQASCLAGGLVAEFDDDALMTIRYGSLGGLSDEETDRYLRLVTACVTAPGPAAAPVAASDVGPTPLTQGERQARDESAEVLDHRVFESFTGWSLSDHEGAAVNVEDGERASAPPADGVRPVEVWLFGGNALFGPAQRDDATIPSQLSALAAADGVPILVRNQGVPGYSNHQETVALADALARGERPAVVVFYDGFEDLELALGAAFAGLRFRDQADHRQAATFADVIAEARGRSLVTEGRGLLARIDVDLPAAEAVAAAADSLTGSVLLGQLLADSYGIQVVQVWAPNIHTKVLHPSEAALLPALGLGDGRAGVWRLLATELRRQLPAVVVDLSTSLDQAFVPVLVDGSSMTEAGASAMARVLWPAISGPVTTARADGAFALVTEGEAP